MAKIIIYGDIDISPLYISIDEGKELKISGKYPRSITIPSGKHSIFATTITKFERAASGFSDGGFMDAMTTTLQNSTNTTLNGQLEFADSDVLLIQVEQKGMKTNVYNKLMPLSEADNYVYMDKVLAYGEKAPKKKGKWWLLLLLLIILFLLVYFGKGNSVSFWGL